MDIFGIRLASLKIFIFISFSHLVLAQNYDKVEHKNHNTEGSNFPTHSLPISISNKRQLDHDVGCVEIISPPEYVYPYRWYDPSAVYHNYGLNIESFDVCFKIDSAGQSVYAESTNIILSPGADTTIVFPQWHPFPDFGLSYEGVSYTVLIGDQNPSNDTLTLNMLTTLWERLADFPEPSSGHSMASAADGTIMVMGVNTTSGYSSHTWIYDIPSDSWTQGPDNPYGCGAYGMMYAVGGKYYRFGGTDNWPTPLDRVDIYDPVTSTWSSGNTMPIANMDMIGGVYNDSLVFMFGGGNWGGGINPHTSVYFYDTYEDSWTQATSFSGYERGCHAGGIVYGKAVIACGYDGSPYYLNDYIVGHINPSNPTVITWDTPMTIPGMTQGRYRVPSCVEEYGGDRLWLVGGQIEDRQTSGEVWFYDHYWGGWQQWYEKPQPVSNVTPFVTTWMAVGPNIGAFVASGWDYGVVLNHEVCWINGLGIREKTNTLAQPTDFGFVRVNPNPTKGFTSISYITSQPGAVILNIYDVAGRLRRTLVNNPAARPGINTVFWDGKDANQLSLPCGIYFLRLQCKNKTANQKLIIIK